MRLPLRTFAALLLCTAMGAVAQQASIVSGPVLRAAYISTNAAQAVRDPQSGEFRGVSADVARDLGRRLNKPVEILPQATAADVINAVQKGEADIGFVAPNPARMVLAYSQTYMLVQQSFLVREGSSIKSTADLDRAGQVLGANTGDSVGTYIKGNFKQAQVLESPDYTMNEAVRWLADGKVVAFGGNRQRLGMAAGIDKNLGLRLLPDNLYAVPQAIAIAPGNPALLAFVNSALDEMRSSGFLEAAVRRGGIEGVGVAPSSVQSAR
ncbi:MAG: transporter substrate-binding domain-containing protein [Pseudomonadota bacterium]